MDEVLSQEEIDQILEAINGESTDHEDSMPDMDTKKIKKYDFKQPDRFTREQIWVLSRIHETFARKIGITITNYLHSLVPIKVANIYEIAYEEFLYRISTPTTLGIVMTAIGNIVMEFDPIISFAMIETLFGGYDTPNNPHELTSLEALIMGDIINVIFYDFKKAWKDIIDINPKLLTVAINPMNVGIALPQEKVIFIVLEVRIRGKKGTMSICFPYRTLKPILKKLTAKMLCGDKGTNMEKTTSETSLNRVKIPITVKFGEKLMPLEEIRNIGEGTVIELDTLSGEALDVYAGDILIGRGEALVVNKNLGIKMVEAYNENTEKTNP